MPDQGRRDVQAALAGDQAAQIEIGVFAREKEVLVEQAHLVEERAAIESGPAQAPMTLP